MLDLVDMLIFLLIIINLTSAVLLLPYGVNFLILSWKARKWKTPPSAPLPADSDLPIVTVHLPIYNEPLMINDLLRSITHLDYPQDKLQILVLDDSTDETTEIIHQNVQVYKENSFNIEVIHRSKREGFKAGALANAFSETEGEYIAMFDADFRPKPDFLRRALSVLITNPERAGVQGRWIHANRSETLLTRCISIGVDGNFQAEQAGRGTMNGFVMFNGSGGVWRCSVIENMGGWTLGCLTEDMDLSLRAYLENKPFIYSPDLTVEQCLVTNIAVFERQQVRCARGYGTIMRERIGQIYRSENISLSNKWQIFIQLFAYLVPFLFFVNFFSTVALLWLDGFHLMLTPPFSYVGGVVYTFVTITTIAGYLAYALPQWRLRQFNFMTIIWIVGLAVVGFGIALRIGLGFLTGFFVGGGEFDRTPKRSTGRSLSAKKISYRRAPFTIELILLFLLLGAFWKLLAFWTFSEFRFVVLSLGGFMCLVAIGLLMYIGSSLRQRLIIG